MTKYVFIVACCLILAGGGFWLVSRHGGEIVQQPNDAAPSQTEKRIPIHQDKVIDYDKLQENSDKALTALMKERKEPYGVEKSIDMIVKPDESISVGGETVPMKKILDEVRLKQGKFLETDLKTGARPKQTDEYGIHVVHAAENIWDIHFRLLKDYYQHKDIQVSPVADEPDPREYSSGVGKVLKFSEHMIHIYNLKKRRLETELNFIYPLSKVVIYNMSVVFGLLDRIDYKDVNRIEFDGETLWLPAAQ